MPCHAMPAMPCHAMPQHAMLCHGGILKIAMAFFG
jgi:hypothetical protein